MLMSCVPFSRYPWWYRADRLNEGPAGQQLAPALDFSARRPANPFAAGATDIAAPSVTGFEMGATPYQGAMSFVPGGSSFEPGALSNAPTAVI